MTCTIILCLSLIDCKSCPKYKKLLVFLLFFVAFFISILLLLLLWWWWYIFSHCDRPFLCFDMAIHNNITKGQSWIVFIVFLLINIVSSGGHLDWRDGVEAFVVTESMVLKNSAKFHSDVPSVRELYAEIWLSKYDLFSQPTYTPRSLLLSAIAIPFY